MKRMTNRNNIEEKEYSYDEVYEIFDVDCKFIYSIEDSNKLNKRYKFLSSHSLAVEFEISLSENVRNLVYTYNREFDYFTPVRIDK